LETDQMTIKIGDRPPEKVTIEEVTELYIIAEEWLKFCRDQERTEKEKQMGWNACDRCPLKGTFCCKFREFFKTRQEKLEKQIRTLEATKEQSAKDLLSLTRLIVFIEGKTTEPY